MDFSFQVQLDSRYDYDDPDIEEKVWISDNIIQTVIYNDQIRSSDVNCIRSSGLDLRTEHFVVTYSADLMPIKYNSR